MQALGQALASFPSPSHTAEDGGHVDWEGADFAILDICDTLRLMRAEPSLLKYLDALVGLRESPFLPRCKQLTRLRLQAELYALTQARLPSSPQPVSQGLILPISARRPCILQGCSRRLTSPGLAPLPLSRRCNCLCQHSLSTTSQAGAGIHID